MITKATRFQIVKPLDTTWDELGQILRDLSYQATRMCNAAIQMYWEQHNLRLRHKSETGKYPGKEDEQRAYGCSHRNYVYRRLREMYPLMASSNTSQTNQFAMNRWKNDVADVMRLQKSIPSFRLGAPVQVANQNYRLDVIESEKPEFQVDVTLLGKGAEQGRFKLLLDGGDGTKKAVFRRILEGTYKQGAMQIVHSKKKKKWFCVVSYTFTPVKKEGLDETRTMGIVLGIGKFAAYWTFNHGRKRSGLPIAEVEAAEVKIRAISARRKDVQRTAGARGHGRKRRLAATENARGRSSDIRDAIAHKYSRRLVDIAVANMCGRIVVGIPDESAVKSFPWASLALKIAYKAAEKGVIAEDVGVREVLYTCSACGHSNPENIEGNTEFLVCKRCKEQLGMAYNAAKNIVTQEGEKKLATK